MLLLDARQGGAVAASTDSHVHPLAGILLGRVVIGPVARSTLCFAVALAGGCGEGEVAAASGGGGKRGEAAEGRACEQGHSMRGREGRKVQYFWCDSGGIESFQSSPQSHAALQLVYPPNVLCALCVCSSCCRANLVALLAVQSLMQKTAEGSSSASLATVAMLHRRLRDMEANVANVRGRKHTGIYSARNPGAWSTSNCKASS